MRRLWFLAVLSAAIALPAFAQEDAGSDKPADRGPVERIPSREDDSPPPAADDWRDALQVSQEWRLVSEDADGRMFMQGTRPPSKRRAWVRFEFAHGRPLSVVALVQYGCGPRQLRYLQMTEYSGRNLSGVRGATRQTRQWQRVATGSHAERGLDFICRSPRQEIEPPPP